MRQLRMGWVVILAVIAMLFSGVARAAEDNIEDAKAFLEHINTEFRNNLARNSTNANAAQNTIEYEPAQGDDRNAFRRVQALVLRLVTSNSDHINNAKAVNPESVQLAWQASYLEKSERSLSQLEAGLQSLYKSVQGIREYSEAFLKMSPREVVETLDQWRKQDPIRSTVEETVNNAKVPRQLNLETVSDYKKQVDDVVDAVEHFRQDAQKFAVTANLNDAQKEQVLFASEISSLNNGEKISLYEVIKQKRWSVYRETVSQVRGLGLPIRKQNKDGTYNPHEVLADEHFNWRTRAIYLSAKGRTLEENKIDLPNDFQVKGVNGLETAPPAKIAKEQQRDIAAESKFP
jgi:hypothetical protein